MAIDVGFDYDDEECEQFCWHLQEVIRVCDAIEDRFGADYGEEYRRQLAEVIISARADGRDRELELDPPLRAVGRR